MIDGPRMMLLDWMMKWGYCKLNGEIGRTNLQKAYNQNKKKTALHDLSAALSIASGEACFAL